MATTKRKKKKQVKHASTKKAGAKKLAVKTGDGVNDKLLREQLRKVLSWREAHADWKQALAGRSKYTGINLDIGHFTAANFDPASFLEEHHARIITLHIKDRKKDHGPNTPLGQGDTNIKGVLEVLKTKKYPIPAMIEYEYGKPGMDTVAEVKKCFDYCKAALA